MHKMNHDIFQDSTQDPFTASIPTTREEAEDSEDEFICRDVMNHIFTFTCLSDRLSSLQYVCKEFFECVKWCNDHLNCLIYDRFELFQTQQLLNIRIIESTDIIHLRNFPLRYQLIEQCDQIENRHQYRSQLNSFKALKILQHVLVLQEKFRNKVLNMDMNEKEKEKEIEIEKTKKQDKKSQLKQQQRLQENVIKKIEFDNFYFTNVNLIYSKGISFRNCRNFGKGQDNLIWLKRIFDSPYNCIEILDLSLTNLTADDVDLLCEIFGMNIDNDNDNNNNNNNNNYNNNNDSNYNSMSELDEIMNHKTNRMNDVCFPSSPISPKFANLNVNNYNYNTGLSDELGGNSNNTSLIYSNIKLKKLILAGNSIGDDCVEILFNTVLYKLNHCLEVLSLHDTIIDDESCVLIYNCFLQYSNYCKQDENNNEYNNNRNNTSTSNSIDYSSNSNSMSLVGCNRYVALKRIDFGISLITESGVRDLNDIFLQELIWQANERNIIFGFDQSIKKYFTHEFSMTKLDARIQFRRY